MNYAVLHHITIAKGLLTRLTPLALLVVILILSGTSLAAWAATVVTVEAGAQEKEHAALNVSPASIVSATSPTPTCTPVWSVVDSPNPGSSPGLSGVSAVSASDVWAVGSSGQFRTLTTHWDGAQWTYVPSPSPGINMNLLLGVAAISSNDAWAVGYYEGGSGDRALLEHWNGSQWSVYSSPVITTPNELYGVTAISSDDVWAVGKYTNNGGSLTLALHWNGTQWSAVPSPNPSTAEPTNNVLRSVSGVSSDDIWAVGQYLTASGRWETMTLHWNGAEWSQVPSPSPMTDNPLYSVYAISSDDVWAVGYADWQTLTLHWNGSEWSRVPSPNPIITDGTNTLYSVTATSSNDVWAVGYYCCAGGRGWTLVLHWDGSAWSQVYSPSPGTWYNSLGGVVAITSQDVWAVGYYRSYGAPQMTLVEHYTDPCITPSPVPATSTSTSTSTSTRTSTATTTATPTQTTPGIPTSTYIPTYTPTPTFTAIATSTSTPTYTSTSTSTPAPTACSLQFEDVPPENAFYQQVRCLACLGIVGGYSDGTFRPNNQVTRGQLAKIVSNSAGFSDPPGSQMFEDVLPGSTFYDWVQRLASRGYISGYQCGSAGEPCDGENRPYFRPGNNATRGQISKIVSNSAQFNDPPGSQIFEDVLPGSTFYEWIQRLASRGVMGGYPCGSPGEPCISGKPYFRPQNNATRGQTSKIVANIFFSGCAPAYSPRLPDPGP